MRSGPSYFRHLINGGEIVKLSMLTLILSFSGPKAGPHSGWTPDELGIILLLAGAVSTFVAAMFIQSRKKPNSEPNLRISEGSAASVQSPKERGKAASFDHTNGSPRAR